MKTREELLKHGYNLDANSMIYGKRLVQAIISAPTEEQIKCQYCHGERKAKPIVADSSDFLAFDKSGIVAFGNDGSVTTGENYTKFRYCPMCARKLGDEE